MLVEKQVSYFRSKQKMTSFKGQARWAKMKLTLGKLTARMCLPTKKVNKARELTCLSTNIENYKDGTYT